MTWALVTTRSGAATQPEPSTPRPQAVPRTRTTERRAATTSGSATMAPSGRATGTAGPEIDGAGSTLLERVQDRPRGRQQVVEVAEDQRPLDVAAQLRRSRGCGGRRPRTPRRARGRRRRSARRRRRRRAACSVRPADHPLAEAEGDALERHRDERLRPAAPRARRTAASRGTRSRRSAAAARAGSRRRRRR